MESSMNVEQLVELIADRSTVYFGFEGLANDLRFKYKCPCQTEVR